MKDPQKALDLREALYANSDVLLYALRLAATEALRPRKSNVSRRVLEQRKRQVERMQHLAEVITQERQTNHGKDFFPNI